MSGETVYMRLSKEERLRNKARMLEEASHGIYVLMDDQEVSRTELAKRLGCNKSFVTKILEGSHNFKLETIADVYLSLGRTLHFLLSEPEDSMRLPIDEKHESSTTQTNWIADLELDEVRVIRTAVSITTSISDDITVGAAKW